MTQLVAGSCFYVGQKIMQPIILALDTVTDACSVAVCTSGQIFSNFVVEPQAHSKLILSMIDELCIRAGIKLDDISAFAFGCGPGSFTGVRIGVSVVQGLAFGLNKPVIAVSSLQALAQQASNKHKVAHILPMIDARMHEVYWGEYILKTQGLVTVLREDSMQKPEELIFSQDVEYIAVGTGAIAYKDILTQYNTKLAFDQSIQYPLAQEIIPVALNRLQRGLITTAAEALPTYIRNEVAQKTKKNPD